MLHAYGSAAVMTKRRLLHLRLKNCGCALYNSLSCGQKYVKTSFENMLRLSLAFFSFTEK